jgi:hypothetical protein
MRPRGIPSNRIKVLPWYYTEKAQPSRAKELSRALDEEALAETLDTSTYPSLSRSGAANSRRTRTMDHRRLK